MAESRRYTFYVVRGVLVSLSGLSVSTVRRHEDSRVYALATVAQRNQEYLSRVRERRLGQRVRSGCVSRTVFSALRFLSDLTPRRHLHLYTLNTASDDALSANC